MDTSQLSRHGIPCLLLWPPLRLESMLRDVRTIPPIHLPITCAMTDDVYTMFAAQIPCFSNHTSPRGRSRRPVRSLLLVVLCNFTLPSSLALGIIRRNIEWFLVLQHWSGPPPSFTSFSKQLLGQRGSVLVHLGLARASMRL